jgi:hypothetical protein
MPKPSSTSSTDQNTTSSNPIMSFIDTSFKPQCLPHLESPKESTIADVDKSSRNRKKPDSKRSKASPSSDCSNSTTTQSIGQLLRHVPRIYKSPDSLTAQNEQHKLVQTIQTLGMLYSVCGTLDKKFGSNSTLKDGKGGKNWLESIQE